MKKSFIFIILFYLSLTQVLYSFEIKRNFPINNIVALDLNKNTINIAQNSKNVPYLISFVLLENSNCKSLLEFYQQLIERYKIDVYLLLENTSEKSLGYLTNFKISRLYFLRDVNQQYIQPFQILILPTSFLIDQQGVLNNLYIDLNEKTKNQMMKDIVGLLEK